MISSLRVDRPFTGLWSSIDEKRRYIEHLEKRLDIFWNIIYRKLLQPRYERCRYIWNKSAWILESLRSTIAFRPAIRRTLEYPKRDCIGDSVENITRL
jgi:hypothetical protein